MAIKINAREQNLKVGKNPGYYYVMTPELYIALSKEKVIKEAALRSGVSRGVMQACWDAAGEVIKAWATEGHSVAIPGLGTMRFTVRSKAVADVNKVKSNLIKCRRIVFTPSTDLKEELAQTSIQITCYDREGNIVKRVTSADDGTVEDPENDNGQQTTDNGQQTTDNGQQTTDNGQQTTDNGQQTGDNTQGGGTGDMTITQVNGVNKSNGGSTTVTPAQNVTIAGTNMSGTWKLDGSVDPTSATATQVVFAAMAEGNHTVTFNGSNVFTIVCEEDQ